MIKTKLSLLILSLFFLSCEDSWDKYYEPSENLLSNAYEYLQEAGNFTLFLKGTELTGWDATLNGYGMCTVIAPTDEAFEKYLNGRKIEDISLEELNVLIAYHIVENAFDTEKFLGFTMVRPAEKPTIGSGNCHKFRTFSRDPISPMYDPINKKTVNVFNRDKYLPIVSSRLFASKGVSDAEANYKYFFPEVNWQGTDETLHIQNAAVLEYGTPTNNGYVYVIDRVAEPLPNLYQELESRDNFSEFLKVYDKFATVNMDNALTNTYAQPGDTIYVYEHGVLPRLYSEWTYHNENNSNERYYDKWMKYCYNCFAPTNTAMESFRQQFLSHYSSWDDVSFITLYYILKNIVKERQEILFPEIISSNGFTGDYGERWYVNPENIIYHKWCANGLLYGIDFVLEPVLFSTVSAPLFLNPGFETMTQMMHDVSEFPQLIDATEADKYTLFIVSDENLRDFSEIILDKGAANIFGDEKVMQSEVTMTEEAERTLVQSHVVYGAIRDFSKRAFLQLRSLIHISILTKAK
ncbi:MAG: fasciclin domain-containing protein [Odoribacter sp.]|nr:fasciclin domain-containing protein [Odoribacter sp.]